MPQASLLEGDYLAPSEHDLPPQLHASVQRHRMHLSALVGSLRAAGLAEEMIDASVRKLVESYQAELSSALRALRLETVNA